MKITNITKAIDIAYKSNDNVHMVGPHGIGKSEIVNQWAKENGFHCEVLQLPILEVSDLVGMPDIEVTKYGKVTTWAAPEWVQRVKEANANGKPAVIFLDELGRASIDIRQASLQMVLEKRVNEHKFDDVVFVVADNPADQYDSTEFDMALEDRFMSFEVEADIDGWLSYARKNDVMDVIIDYLAEFPEKLHFTPETEGEKGSSPRAWKKLSDALKENKDESFVYSLILSKVGLTVGANFFHYFNNYVDTVKVEDIIEAIGDTPINTEKEQRAAAKKLRKLTKKIEVVSAQELAEKMRHEKTDPKVVTVFLGSLNLEQATAIVKNWLEHSDNDIRDYVLNDLVENMDKKWLLADIRRVVKKD